MKPKIYIDGREGTTGLQIYERLGARDDIDLLLIDEEKRKDAKERRRFLNAADLVFLCLPDVAAREAVELIDNPSTRIIDASTAHRVSTGWDYGFPELNAAQRGKIKASKRVANPGCHATGFIAGVSPLVQAGLIPKTAALTCASLTGYSGGGKKLIAEYEDPKRDPRHESHRVYGLDLQHKHLPEMQHFCDLERAPVFVPILGDFEKGMATIVMLPGLDAQCVQAALEKHYENEQMVTVAPLGGDEPVIYASTLAGEDTLRIIVSGQPDRTIVTTLFDNLGKGASGAAVQNMNLMLGFPETKGLRMEIGRNAG